MIQMEMRQQKIFLLYTAQIRKYDIKHFPPGPAAYPAIAGPEIHKKVFSLPYTISNIKGKGSGVSLMLS